MFPRAEAEAGVLVVVGVGGCHINNIDVFVGNEVDVGTVGLCGLGGGNFGEEGLRPREGG